MAVAHVVTRGYGSFGGVERLPTRGYGAGLQPPAVPTSAASLDYSGRENRLHFGSELPQRLHFDSPRQRLHYTAEE